MVFQRSIVNWSGRYMLSSIYVHSAICDTLCGVTIFHRSIVNWGGGIHVSSVYVHSVICVTYLL